MACCYYCHDNTYSVSALTRASVYFVHQFCDWLFPSRDGDEPMGLRGADQILRTAVERAGLSGKGISTHSTRRSFITKLAKRGVSLATIKKATGHTDLKVLSRYIEVTDDDVKQAIATL
ncbi:tyrosine-type recombinase/integrase [Nostoc sp. CHAB 5784]|nr:tyrosine-type recombinase/integrase [Nostoc mirabile CHAB5784]